MADVVAFGEAPAMILFCYVGYMDGKLGIIGYGLDVVFGGIRHARVNDTRKPKEPKVEMAGI